MKISETILAAAAIGLASISGVNGFFRMPCSQPVVVERADPIVNPGGVSGHLHTIMGGNAFNFTQSYDSSRQATCSSCKAKKDASNYWVPTLFYQAQNGSFHPVTQNGGALIYYLQRFSPGETTVAPFPKGFRMLAGDPTLRSYDASSLSQQAVSHVCLNYHGDSPQTPAIPNNNCPDGLRTQIFFPSCWDGVNLDSANHKDHVAYPDHMDSGACPASHPVRLVSIFYEVIWNVNDFANMWWKSDGSHPFVLAMGDPTGYGYHGDFLNGWDEDALAKAINGCTNNSGVIEDCGSALELWSDDDMHDCQLPPQVNEITTGWLDTLPGCNSVQNGPGKAVMGGACGKTTPQILSKDQVGFIRKDIPLWDGVGCAEDSLNGRLLPKKFTDPAQTIEKCMATCLNNGYTYAGLEWGIECWCGNTFNDSVANLQGSCTQPCAGNASEMCGNAGILSVYKYNPNKPSTPTTTIANPPAQSPTTTSVNGVTLSILPAGSTTPASLAYTPYTGNASPTTTTTTSSTTSSTAATSPTTTTASSNTAISNPPTSGGHAPSGWLYRGCYVDSVWPQRSLPGAGMWYDQPMTPQVCANHCSSKGFVISGTEYSGECYCGNSFRGSVVQKSESECNMPCKGDHSIMCGGAARMSVYSRDMRALKRDLVEEERDLIAEERDLAHDVANALPPHDGRDVSSQPEERDEEIAKRNISNVAARSPSEPVYRHGSLRRTLEHRRRRLSMN